VAVSELNRRGCEALLGDLQQLEFRIERCAYRVQIDSITSMTTCVEAASLATGVA
jgi:hypothetical protein